MIKKRKGSKYNCKLLERALRAEGRFRVVFRAHAHCIQAREVIIASQKQELALQGRVCEVMLERLGGTINIAYEEINKAKGDVVVKEKEDGLSFMTSAAHKELCKEQHSCEERKEP